MGQKPMIKEHLAIQARGTTQLLSFIPPYFPQVCIQPAQRRNIGSRQYKIRANLQPECTIHRVPGISQVFSRTLTLRWWYFSSQTKNSWYKLNFYLKTRLIPPGAVLTPYTMHLFRQESCGCRVQLSAIASDFQMDTSPSRKIKISKQPTNQVDRNFFSRNGLKATISIFEKSVDAEKQKSQNFCCILIVQSVLISETLDQIRTFSGKFDLVYYPGLENIATQLRMKECSS